MPTLQYPKNPNTDTAFVVQDDGTKNRALMTAPQDTSTLELPSNSNSTKGYVTVDGKKQCVILTADIGGGGGSSYTAGTGISIDADNEISVTAPVAQLVESGGSRSIYGLWASSSVTSPYGNIVLGYNASQMNDSVMGATAIGSNASVGNGATAIGSNARASYTDCIAIGASAITTKVGAIQIGYGTNATQNTLQVKSYTLLNLSDGTIPEARLADTTSAQQGDVLTLDSTGNAVWAAGASGTSSISVTLPAADWVNDAQTVTATGVTASNTVIVGAAPASASEYNTSGVICTAQGADSLTFSCSTTPSNDLTVTVLIF